MQELKIDSPTACDLDVKIPTVPQPELTRHKARRDHTQVASLSFSIIDIAVENKPPQNGREHVNNKFVKLVSNVSQLMNKTGTGPGRGRVMRRRELELHTIVEDLFTDPHGASSNTTVRK